MSAEMTDSASHATEKVIKIAGSITVDELAQALGLSVTALVGELFKNGIVATINRFHRLRLHAVVRCHHNYHNICQHRPVLPNCCKRLVPRRIEESNHPVIMLQLVS